MSFIAKKVGGTIYQTLNNYGKCVYLHFEDYNISMSVHPQAPFDYPISDKFYSASLEEIRNFFSKYNKNEDEDYKIKILYQDVKDGKLIGLWIESKPFPYPYYIPLAPSAKLKSIQTADDHFVAPGKRTNELSLVEKEHHLKILSTILREYTIAIAARDPENFSIDGSFEIIEEHTYNIEALHHRIDLTDDTIMYNGKLIVSSKEIAKRLYDHALTMKKNDPAGFRKYITHTFIQHDLQNVMDFDIQEDVSIFSEEFHIEDFIEMNKTNNTRTIRTSFPAKQKLAEVYGPSQVVKHKRPDGSILGPCILQFVKGDSQINALAVSAIWNDDDGVNVGYNPSADTRSNVKSIKRILTTQHIYDVRTGTWSIKPLTKKFNVEEHDIRKIAYLAKFDAKQFAALLPVVYSEI